jgi:hypothetical protein
MTMGSTPFYPRFLDLNDRLPAMEPIRHTLTARLGYLKMYRDEVDQLVAMFQQSCGKVTISDSKYRYDSLEDMKKNVAPRITDFDVRGENPGVRFLFNQMEVVKLSNPPTQTIFNELRTEEITDAADALFYKIKDFLITHQQPRFRKGFSFGAIVSFVGLIWLVSQYSGVDAKGQPILAFRALPEVLILAAALVFFVASGINVKNYLSLETKRNSGSFFIRHREEFAKQAVTAGVSSVIGGVVGYCIGHFLK